VKDGNACAQRSRARWAGDAARSPSADPHALGEGPSGLKRTVG
jgi:hypothetical protein